MRARSSTATPSSTLRSCETKPGAREQHKSRQMCGHQTYTLCSVKSPDTINSTVCGDFTQPPNSNIQAMRHSSKIHIVPLTTRATGEHIVVRLSGWGEGLQAAHYAPVAKP